MRVAVDANVVAAALLRPGGWTDLQLHRKEVGWVAPSVLRQELSRHAETCAARAGCTRTEWNRRLAGLLGRIHLLPTSRLVAQHDHPLVRRAFAIDPYDALYVACLAAREAEFLWTFDKALLRGFPGLALSVPP